MPTVVVAIVDRGLGGLDVDAVEDRADLTVVDLIQGDGFDLPDAERGTDVPRPAQSHCLHVDVGAACGHLAVVEADPPVVLGVEVVDHPEFGRNHRHVAGQEVWVEDELHPVAVFAGDVAEYQHVTPVSVEQEPVVRGVEVRPWHPVLQQFQFTAVKWHIVSFRLVGR